MNDIKPVPEKELGQKSFESALATSFRVLKWAMVVVVAAMLFSGIFVVGPGEKAVRIRFGKMVGVGADKFGFHFPAVHECNGYFAGPEYDMFVCQDMALGVDYYA